MMLLLHLIHDFHDGHLRFSFHFLYLPRIHLHRGISRHRRGRLHLRCGLVYHGFLASNLHSQVMLRLLDEALAALDHDLVVSVGCIEFCWTLVFRSALLRVPLLARSTL